MGRAHGLGPQEMYLLNEWGGQVRRAFPGGERVSAVEPVHLGAAQLVGEDHLTDTERADRDLELARAGFLIANKLNALAGFYRLAAWDGYCEQDPMVRVTRPKIPRESPREGLTRTELHDLVTAAEADPKDYALVTVLGYNGLRVSEALGIDIERLDRHKGQMLVTVKRKGGKFQPIPFAVETAWAIEQLIAGRTEGPLFLSRYGNRLDTPGAGRIVKRLAKQIGIRKRVTPHSLRHTFVTLLRDMGVSDGDIIAATGHADPRMCSYYDRNAAVIQRNPTHQLASWVRRAM